VQRIYRGGLQFHEHYVPENRHTEAKMHDGYWRHLHDEAGMLAIEEGEKEEEK
jgi:hypothetical protein